MFTDKIDKIDVMFKNNVSTVRLCVGEQWIIVGDVGKEMIDDILKTILQKFDVESINKVMDKKIDNGI